MKIKEYLGWDKHTGDLIGFVDLGDPELNFTTLKRSSELASHVLVFLLRSIVNPFKFSLANFATTNAKSTQLFPLFGKQLESLRISVGLKLLVLPVMVHLQTEVRIVCIRIWPVWRISVM